MQRSLLANLCHMKALDHLNAPKASELRHDKPVFAGHGHHILASGVSWESPARQAQSQGGVAPAIQSDLIEGKSRDAVIPPSHNSVYRVPE